MDRQRFLISALALLTVFRLALLPTIELSPDEALAVMSGQRWQVWYLEMGPLVPWLVRVSTALFGHSEFGVRCLAPLLVFAASVCVFRLTRGIFDETIAAWAVLLMQVLPGVNLAATTMTSATVGLASLCGLVLSLRIALHRAHHLHPAWWVASGCLLAAMLADWRNGLAYLCTALALWTVPRRRHHFFDSGFLIISGGFAIAVLMFGGWNWLNDWPVWEAGEAEAVWILFPNLLRWILMASPVMLTLIVWAITRAIKRWAVLPEHALLLAFILPYALLDLGWGPLERWPHAGWPLWMVLGGVLLAYHMMGRITMPMPSKIALRTAAVLLAGIQSMLLMRTDMLRSLHVAWPFQQEQTKEEKTYAGFLRVDPSSNMIGWQQCATIVQGGAELAVQTKSTPWFIIAKDWRLAAALEHYLPLHVPLVQLSPDTPRVQTIQSAERDNPLALWPRYDEMHGQQAGNALMNALYVTDDEHASQPPTAIRQAFEKYELLSSAIIMHGGWPVRSIKVFACYYYKPPAI